jgi:hypothetical protein
MFTTWSGVMLLLKLAVCKNERWRSDSLDDHVVTLSATVLQAKGRWMGVGGLLGSALADFGSSVAGLWFQWWWTLGPLLAHFLVQCHGLWVHYWRTFGSSVMDLGSYGDGLLGPALWNLSLLSVLTFYSLLLGV